MKKAILLLSGTVLLSCSSVTEHHHRSIASISTQQLMMESPENLSNLVDEKLQALHTYYTIGQKHLQAFDRALVDLSTEEAYQTNEYALLMAVRIEAEKIEHELTDINDDLRARKSTAFSKILQEKVAQFASKSVMSSLSMENISFQLGMKLKQNKSFYKLSDELSKEMAILEPQKEFLIYEKNLEHIAHSLSVKTQSAKRFAPSTTKSGNITGLEFPEKVWSLTFDDGPGVKTTRQILANLQKRKMKASFFQLTSKARENKTVAKELRDAGMEIASHSYTHKQLTKVSAAELEREITTAVKDLQAVHDGAKIRFFRLPYGAGVGTTSVRQKIADNNLIHVFWSIDTLDWMAQPASDVVKRTLEMMKKSKSDAGVILFHDIHQRTADATPQVMDYLQKDGRRTCTLAKIVDDMNNNPEKVCSN